MNAIASSATISRIGSLVHRLALPAALLSLASPAHAGVVSVSEGTLFYRAAAGEANALTVVFSHDPGPEPEGQASITDAGAPLTAGPGCQTLGPSTAMCVLPPGPQPPVEINLRGRADSLVLSGTLITNFLNVGAGAGDDRVSLEALVFFDREFSGASVYGSDGNDVVNGGPDDTLIDPGRGDDVVRGGAGNDYIYADAGDDRIKGGPGPHDRYAPQLAPGPVVINLTTGIARGNGNDRLSGIEDLNGSSGNDSLTGDANRNHIYGDFGNDRLSGGGGDDFLLGTQGRDLIFGENGDDRLYGHDARDRLFGGRGRDAIAGFDGRDLLVGGPGPDRLIGGSQDDRLLARDGNRDQVQGGRGRDCASFDRRDRLFSIEALCGGGLGGVLAGRGPGG